MKQLSISTQSKGRYGETESGRALGFGGQSAGLAYLGKLQANNRLSSKLSIKTGQVRWLSW